MFTTQNSEPTTSTNSSDFSLGKKIQHHSKQTEVKVNNLEDNIHHQISPLKGVDEHDSSAFIKRNVNVSINQDLQKTANLTQVFERDNNLSRRVHELLESDSEDVESSGIFTRLKPEGVVCATPFALSGKKSAKFNFQNTTKNSENSEADKSLFFTTLKPDGLVNLTPFVSGKKKSIKDNSDNDKFNEDTSMLFTTLKPDGLVNLTKFESNLDQNVVQLPKFSNNQTMGDSFSDNFSFYSLANAEYDELPSLKEITSDLQKNNYTGQQCCPKTKSCKNVPSNVYTHKVFDKQNNTLEENKVFYGDKCSKTQEKQIDKTSLNDKVVHNVEKIKSEKVESLQSIDCYKRPFSRTSCSSNNISDQSDSNSSYSNKENKYLCDIPPVDLNNRLSYNKISDEIKSLSKSSQSLKNNGSFSELKFTKTESNTFKDLENFLNNKHANTTNTSKVKNLKELDNDLFKFLDPLQSSINKSGLSNDSLALQVKNLLEASCSTVGFGNYQESFEKVYKDESVNLSRVLNDFENTDLWNYVKKFMPSKDPMNESWLSEEDLKNKKPVSQNILSDKKNVCSPVNPFCCSPIKSKSHYHVKKNINTYRSENNKNEFLEHLPNSITSTPISRTSKTTTSYTHANLNKGAERLSTNKVSSLSFDGYVNKKFEDYLKSEKFQSPIKFPEEIKKVNDTSPYEIISASNKNTCAISHSKYDSYKEKVYATRKDDYSCSAPEVNENKSIKDPITTGENFSKELTKNISTNSFSNDQKKVQQPNVFVSTKSKDLEEPLDLRTSNRGDKLEDNLERKTECAFGNNLYQIDKRVSPQGEATKSPSVTLTDITPLKNQVNLSVVGSKNNTKDEISDVSLKIINKNNEVSSIVETSKNPSTLSAQNFNTSQSKKLNTKYDKFIDKNISDFARKLAKVDTKFEKFQEQPQKMLPTYDEMVGNLLEDTSTIVQSSRSKEFESMAGLNHAECYISDNVSSSTLVDVETQTSKIQLIKKDNISESNFSVIPEISLDDEKESLKSLSKVTNTIQKPFKNMFSNTKSGNVHLTNQNLRQVVTSPVVKPSISSKVLENSEKLIPWMPNSLDEFQKMNSCSQVVIVKGILKIFNRYDPDIQSSRLKEQQGRHAFQTQPEIESYFAAKYLQAFTGGKQNMVTHQHKPALCNGIEVTPQLAVQQLLKKIEIQKSINNSTTSDETYTNESCNKKLHGCNEESSENVNQMYYVKLTESQVKSLMETKFNSNKNDHKLSLNIKNSLQSVVPAKRFHTSSPIKKKNKIF